MLIQVSSLLIHWTLMTKQMQIYALWQSTCFYWLHQRHSKNLPNFQLHFFSNGDWTIHGEWNIDDTVGKIYSACSQNFYLSNNLFFYMTFMNSLNRNDFNVNVILNKFKFKEKCLHILLRHKKQYFIYLSMLFVFLGNCSSNKSEWCNKIHKKI